MLLKHLYDYATSRNLLEDPAFSQKAVRWIIDLDANGNLLGQGPIDTAVDGKRGKEFSCPQTTRAKNAGGVSEFLADGITAIFGLEGDLNAVTKKGSNVDWLEDRKKNNAAKKADFWHQMEVCGKSCASIVVCQKYIASVIADPPFLRRDGNAWKIISALGEEKKLGPENFTFRVNGNLLLEDEKVRDWWRDQYNDEVSKTKTKAKRGLCIVTGEANQPIAETHGVKIMGVPGGQSSGASLVSFDKDAFASYGFQQSMNCPTSEDAAIAYCKALNALIQGKDTSLRIAGTVLCFWAAQTKNAGGLFESLLNKPDPQSIATFMRSPWAGIERELAKKDQFIAVTLKGCAGRVAVSHWIQEPLDKAIENFKTWFTDLEITVPPQSALKAAKKTTEKKTEYNPLSIYWLANTTVREAKALRPEILSQIYRAALEGSVPSIALIKPILMELRSKLGDKDYKLIYDESRFALLRLILNRNRKESDMEIRPQLTADTDDPAYNCGRILAILSQTQKKALDNWNLSGVAERYFGTASAAPATVLPLLIRLNRHHLEKIRKTEGSAYEEKILSDILARFKGKDDHQPPVFPRYLDLQAQGRFALGFYQQQAEEARARLTRRVLEYLNETDANANAEVLGLRESDLQAYYEKVSLYYGSTSFREWSDKKQKKGTAVSLSSDPNHSDD